MNDKQKHQNMLSFDCLKHVQRLLPKCYVFLLFCPTPVGLLDFLFKASLTSLHEYHASVCHMTSIVTFILLVPSGYNQ